MTNDVCLLFFVNEGVGWPSTFGQKANLGFDIGKPYSICTGFLTARFSSRKRNYLVKKCADGQSTRGSSTCDVYHLETFMTKIGEKINIKIPFYDLQNF